MLPRNHICSCPSRAALRLSANFWLLNSTRSPTAFMLRCHSSLYCRSSAARSGRDLQHERLAVRQIAPAVLVAVDVAELVEQRLRGRRIELRVAVEFRVVAGNVRRNGLRRRERLARAQHADLLVDVVRHADRAPQRDLVRRVAADDRILHVEVRIRDRGLDAARERDALLGEARLQLVARVEHVRHEVGRHRHVVEIALLEGEEARIRFLDDADLDAADQRQLPAREASRTRDRRDGCSPDRARRETSDSPPARSAGRGAIP